MLFYAISLVHILFMLFVIIVPFTNQTYYLLLHSIIVPFVIFHWMTNNNVCFLTLVEKKLRKDVFGSEGDCLTCKLIEPVYDFKKNFEKFSKIIYFLTIVLWSISFGKLLLKYHDGKIVTFDDLFINV